MVHIPSAEILPILCKKQQRLRVLPYKMGLAKLCPTARQKYGGVKVKIISCQNSVDLGGSGEIWRRAGEQHSE